MASARNKAPKAPGGWGVRRKCPFPTREGCGEVAMSSPQNVFRFWAQNGKFWCILRANFIAVELSYTHKPVSLDFGFVKPAIALLCVKKVGVDFCMTVPIGLKSGRTRPLSPPGGYATGSVSALCWNFADSLYFDVCADVSGLKAQAEVEPHLVAFVTVKNGGGAIFEST